MKDDLGAQTRVRVPQSVLFTAVDDRAALLELESETYYDLDPIGTRLWSALVEGASVGEAAADLAETFDAPRERIESDLIDLVEALRNHGLVVVDH